MIHLGRTDEYEGVDVPHVEASDTNITSDSWAIKRAGQTVARIEGEFWRNGTGLILPQSVAFASEEMHRLSP